MVRTRAAAAPGDPTLGRLRPLDVPAPAAAAPSPGVHPLGLGGRRDGLLLVPPPARAEQPPTDGATPVRLLVALHGAGGGAQQMLDLLAGAAAEHGLVVLAPDSRSTTWDVIMGGYGPDVEFLDAALARAAALLPLDAAALAVSGFSDGASYAISLAVANGDLFGRALGWSPGFAAPLVSHGSPRFYVSHGVRDRVLPIDRCSRRLVPRLRSSGYDVVYQEFPDGHEVPAQIIEDSFRWLRLADPAAGSVRP